jgi:glycosyltransferase involved in cell wall biosynthesis
MIVVHVVAGTGLNESRVIKESYTLVQKYPSTQVCILGTVRNGEPKLENVFNSIFIKRWQTSSEWMRRMRFLELFRKFLWIFECRKAIVGSNPSVIIAHSVGTLPSAILASHKLRVPVVYDCHELERGTIGASSGIWKLVATVFEKTFLPKASAVIVVNDSIADWYENEYGFRPYVLKAYPDARWQSVDSEKTKFRSKFGIPENDIIFLYQGGLMKGRRVEQLIDVFEQAASDRHLVFMGYGELEPLVREASSRCSRIHFHEAVPPDQVLHYTTSADVGICGAENVCLSYYYGLSNKLMEYIHAGIALLSPDFPEMRKVVLENKCGWVHEESTDSIRTQVNNLTKAEIAEKAANSVVARSSLTWESQEHVLVEVIERVLKTSVR